MDFHETLNQFLKECEADQAMQDFAKEHKAILHFQIADEGLNFFLSFVGGVLKAGLGVPTEPADLAIKTKSETFDGVMSGAINGLNAALSGKFEYSGEPIKVIALQGIMNDLMRLYTRAKSKGEVKGD